MKPLLDLVAGRPRAKLAPTRLLAGEVTTPYGSSPSDEVVAPAWNREAGEREMPAWFPLGRRDAPSGTIWGVAWCPPTSPLPAAVEIVLPDALWVFELLASLPAQEGWHLRTVAAPDGIWASLWEGPRCDHLQPPPFPPPGSEPSAALERVRALADRRGVEATAALEASWVPPPPERLRELADIHPEAELLEMTESVKRCGSRSDAAALARIGSIALVFAVVAAAFGVFQMLQAHRLRAQETRLESVRALVDHVGALAAARGSQVDSLHSLQEALRPGHAVDVILARLAAATPPTIRLQALALEETPTGWRLRTEARVPDWAAVQPYAQRLRALPNIAKVAIANQARQAESVSAILELEGTWP